MKESIKVMLNGSEYDIQKFIADFKDEFKKLPVEEISFPRSVNGTKKYAGQAHIYKERYTYACEQCIDL
jgi:hypothetical protein